MGIFNRKQEKTLLQKLQDDIEGSERWIQTKRNLLSASMPLIEKYKEYFSFGSIHGSDMSLYVKEDMEVDPQIFCDAGKFGLKCIQRRSYSSSDMIEISFAKN